MKIDKAKMRFPVTSNSADTSKKYEQRVSAYTESYKDEYYNLDIEKLIPYKNQARKLFDQNSLDNLAKTIKKYGVRQPLTVLPCEEKDGLYEIISGERRWRAAQIANLKKVPCIILRDRDSIEEIALIENIQRQNLHPLELMKGFQQLLKKASYKNQNELAARLGLNRTTIVEIMALDKLPSNTQNLLLKNQIKSRKLFRKLLKSPEIRHESILKETLTAKLDSSSQKHIEKRKKRKKLITISLEGDDIVLDETEKWKLSVSQKLSLANYLKKLVEKFEN